MTFVIIFVVLFSAFAIFVHSQECNIQIAEYGTVCVCNATYCDTVPSLDVSPGNYQFYSTSKSKLGFYSKTGSFITNAKKSINTITVDQSTTFQKIIGFGGAFTDATGINIASLNEAAQQKLIESYFSDTGNGYNLCRVPLAGTDFSTRAYSYDDNWDPLLTNFTLQPEDINYKIPYILQAKKLRKNQLKLYGSVWTAPPWMKTNDLWTGLSLLEAEYYETWAHYFIKFFDAYQANNISFWGVTTQNEPSTGFYPNVTINAMAWTPSQLNFWVSANLGPTLERSVHKDVKIILHDDQRAELQYLYPLLKDELTMKYADGVGIHWYTDTEVPPSILETVKSPFKDIFIIGTEACNGFLAIEGLEPPVEKGSWDRGAKYAVDIIGSFKRLWCIIQCIWWRTLIGSTRSEFEVNPPKPICHKFNTGWLNLLYGASGWVDWNMVLDETGGPNYINNFVDAPVLVNSTLQEFYKQPMFYALGHFSKFFVPGSVRVKTTVSKPANSSGVQAVAFLRPDRLTALLIYNNGTSDITIQVSDSKNQVANVNVEKFSINTVLFQ